MAEALAKYPDSDFSDDDQSPLEVAFNKASDHVRKITTKLNNNQLLDLYGLYKQSTEGKCNIAKPGWLDGKGRKKWEAWRSLGDMPCDEAKQKYIDLVQQYDPECELVEETGSKQQWVAVSSLQRSSEPDLLHEELSLLYAARENMGELVSQLITNNPDIMNQRDDDGLTALHWAADRNATAALKAAIQSGCDINAMDSSGQTPLHYSASCGHVEATQILINAGARLLKDEDDCSPLDLAADEEIRNILCAK